MCCMCVYLYMYSGCVDLYIARCLDRLERVITLARMSLRLIVLDVLGAWSF
jgi:hypothetical protein